MNKSSSVRYDPIFLASVSPWIYRYWKESAPKNLLRATVALRPLLRKCVSDHDYLATRAKAKHLIRPGGWIEIYHNQAKLQLAEKHAHNIKKNHNVPFRHLDAYR